MKKLFLITIATALLVGGALAAMFASHNEATDLFKANLEALADGENANDGDSDDRWPRYQKEWRQCTIYEIIEYTAEGKVFAIFRSEIADFHASVEGHYRKVIGPDIGMKSYCMDGKKNFCFQDDCR